MTVKDILTITGGNTKFYIRDTQLAYGIVNNIKHESFTGYLE